MKRSGLSQKQGPSQPAGETTNGERLTGRSESGRRILRVKAFAGGGVFPVLGEGGWWWWWCGGKGKKKMSRCWCVSFVVVVGSSCGVGRGVAAFRTAVGL